MRKVEKENNIINENLLCFNYGDTMGTYKEYNMKNNSYIEYGGFSKYKLAETIKDKKNVSLDEMIKIIRSNTELIALTEQYLYIFDQLSKCTNKSMENPKYKELEKNKIKLLIKIHKFFPDKNEKEVIAYLNEVVVYKSYLETVCFADQGSPRTIDYLR